MAAIVAMCVAFRNHTRALVRSRHDALTDTLTGLGNRRKLLEDLEDLLANGDSRLLVVLDLDGFKAYNDVFGHPAGDALLARLGRRIDAALPPHARAYRLGGDEFCALVRDRGADHDAIVAAVSGALAESGESLTASHGMIAIPREANTAERALQLVDRRLYADKSVRDSHGSRGEVRDALAQELGARGAASEDLAPAAELSGRVARELGLWGEELELVVRAADLHDVGMAAIPEAILSEAHPLDDMDRALLHHHTLVGERMLKSAEPLSAVARLVRASDERYDGSGYPDGLSGESIPLGARIVAACAAYQALRSPQGADLSRRAAILRLRQEAGHRFDPEVVEALASATARTRDGSNPRARVGMLALLALGAVLVALPATALAGTASVSRGALKLTASPGQANKVTIDVNGDGASVKDEGPGATLTPGPGCTASAPAQLSCSTPTSINADLGDGNDSLVAYAWVPMSVKGGPGDDAIYGSGGKDNMDGGDGNDLIGGGFGGDNLKGGPGNDTVDYSYYTSPVNVSLDGVANDGMANERSNVGLDIENITGGKGDDTLSGNGAANVIDGAPGQDVLRGQGGDDVFHARDGQVDNVTCGSGRDQVIADDADVLGSDCDSSLITNLASPLAAAPTPLRVQSKPVRLTHKGLARVGLRCYSRITEGCTGTMAIYASTASVMAGTARASASRKPRRRAIGTARFSVRGGHAKVIAVHISRNGRRRILRKRRLRCRTSVAVTRADGSRTTVGGVLVLVAPKGAS